jgi:hypothetical protein
MSDSVEMGTGVTVGGAVAAPDVSADHAEPQVYPVTTGTQAVLATVRAGRHLVNLAKMGTDGWRHDLPLRDGASTRAHAPVSPR